MMAFTWTFLPSISVRWLPASPVSGSAFRFTQESRSSWMRLSTSGCTPRPEASAQPVTFRPGWEASERMVTVLKRSAILTPWPTLTLAAVLISVVSLM